MSIYSSHSRASRNIKFKNHAQNSIKNYIVCYMMVEGWVWGEKNAGEKTHKGSLTWKHWITINGRKQISTALYKVKKNVLRTVLRIIPVTNTNASPITRMAV